MAEPVTLINVSEVPHAEAARLLAAWQPARDHLSSQPGYMDTSLHQATSPETSVQFVNIAHWRGPEDFMAATRSPDFQPSAAGLARYPSHPGLYQVIGS